MLQTVRGGGEIRMHKFILSKNWIANEGKSDFFPLQGENGGFYIL